jgi:CelD/BcsL family acetyltransferase involved in cellulose biosynthesis
MRVSVVRPGELGPAEAALWAKFQHQSPVTLNPFLSLTFAQAVGQARANARVAVIEDGGQIEAFLPYQLGPGRIGMPIGYPMNDLQGFIGSGAPLDARHVVRQAGLRGWRFIAAPAEQAVLAPHHYEGTLAPCPVIDLTGGYQAYYASRSKSVTTEPARKRRALERQHGPVTLAWNTASTGHLRQMIAWKSGRYNSLGRMFSTDPTALRIAEDLVGSGSEDCRGVVSVLFASAQAVAVSCNLIVPGGLSGWFTAYDPDLGRFSPGMIMALALAEDAARHGLTRLDLAPGPFGYKHRLANQSYRVAGGAVWASRVERAARKIYRGVYYDRHGDKRADG